ncbi:hypothetical protein GQ53DRAFT_230387 [Thozetella sp. PMI_491]|nr:hypothetical protein GQ53DRAFT_230387 [Thozetella sp. PMI_491]
MALQGVPRGVRGGTEQEERGPTLLAAMVSTAIGAPQLRAPVGTWSGVSQTVPGRMAQKQYRPPDSSSHSECEICLAAVRPDSAGHISVWTKGEWSAERGFRTERGEEAATIQGSSSLWPRAMEGCERRQEHCACSCFFLAEPKSNSGCACVCVCGRRDVHSCTGSVQPS